jgi:hypothetical protein
MGVYRLVYPPDMEQKVKVLRGMALCVVGTLSSRHVVGRRPIKPIEAGRT